MAASVSKPIVTSPSSAAFWMMLRCPGWTKSALIATYTCIDTADLSFIRSIKFRKSERGSEAPCDSSSPSTQNVACCVLAARSTSRNSGPPASHAVTHRYGQGAYYDSDRGRFPFPLHWPPWVDVFGPNRCKQLRSAESYTTCRGNSARPRATRPRSSGNASTPRSRVWGVSIRRLELPLLLVR